MTRASLRILAAYALICLIWGTTWLAIKLGLEGIPPFLAAGVRFILAALVFGILVRRKGRGMRFDRTALRSYLLLGLLGFAAPFPLIYWGQQFVTSGMASLLFGVYPFLVAGFTALILKSERITGRKLAGILLGFGGLLVLFLRDLRFDTALALLGGCAIVASSMMQALNVVLLKRDAGGISVYSLNFAAMSIGALLITLLSLCTESYAGIRATPANLLSLLYLALFGTVTTFGVYFWLLKRIDAVILSLSALITPVIAVAAGVLALGEEVSPGMFLGSLLVLTGILTANWEGVRSLRGMRLREEEHA